MKNSINTIVAVTCALGLTCGMVMPAHAAGDWEFRVAPYLWTAGISGEIGPAAMPSSVDVDFGDYIELLNIGAAGSIDGIHKNGWFFYAEGMYAELSDDGQTPEGAKVDVDFDTGYATVVAGKSVFKNFGLFAGGRYLYNRVDIDLGPGLGGDGSQDWADPIVGFRVRGDVNERMFLRLAMDVGGFGANSDVTYALSTNLNYLFNNTWSGIFGYRLLDIDYDKGGFVYDAKLDGLLFGLGYSF